MYGGYAASRLSAHVWPDQVANYEKVFCDVVNRASQSSKEIRQEYRFSENHTVALEKRVSHCKRLLKVASYLLGHVAGLDDVVFNQCAPRAQRALEDNPQFCDTFESLSSILKDLWSNYGHWPGPEVYDPLKELAVKFIHDSGLDVSLTPEGVWVKPVDPFEFCF